MVPFSLDKYNLEWAQWYGVAVLPARVRKPKDKAKAEVAVQVVERWIIARLRNMSFFNLADLNRVIRELLDELNDKPMQLTKKSRREEFDQTDRPALRPLPSQPYEFATYKMARVNIDYHVDFEKHFYSVPYTLIHEEVRILATERMLEILHKSQPEPVALHPRSNLPGRYSTRSAHMPANHQKVGEWNAERLLHWATRIGPHTTALIQAVLTSRQHPEQAFRGCLGILRLASKYTVSQMETACQIALAGQVLNYRGVKDVLENLPPAPAPETAPLPVHENIRGNNYYQ